MNKPMPPPSWIKEIEEILNSCNMRDVWLNPKSYKPDQLKNELTKKLKSANNLSWLNDINTKSTCRTYRTYKKEIKLEKYLLSLDSIERINLSKFRCGNTKIPVVILRYAHLNINYEDRKCTLCNLEEIGDEYHYIISCPHFHQQRQIYLEGQYLTDPDREKFSELMQSQNTSILRKLAKFITEINNYFS